MIQEPASRQIDSWFVAEENAAEWMRYWGHLDAACTSGGADGGVEVRSRSALAQVKFEAVQVGSSAVQRLVGARGMDHHLALFFFSGAGYARSAIDYADVMGIALFKYDLTGRQTAISQAARQVVRVSKVRPTRSSIAAQAAAARQEPKSDVVQGSASQTPGFRESFARGRKVGLSMFERLANSKRAIEECQDTIKPVAEDTRTQTQTPDASKDSGVN